MEPIDATNIERFSAFMNIFATWFDDWMSSGKKWLQQADILVLYPNFKKLPIISFSISWRRKQLSLHSYRKICSQIHWKKGLEGFVNSVEQIILGA